MNLATAIVCRKGRTRQRLSLGDFVQRSEGIGSRSGINSRRFFAFALGAGIRRAVQARNRHKRRPGKGGGVANKVIRLDKVRHVGNTGDAVNRHAAWTRGVGEGERWPIRMCATGSTASRLLVNSKSSPVPSRRKRSAESSTSICARWAILR